jgi:hypothetical protein
MKKKFPNAWKNPLPNLHQAYPKTIRPKTYSALFAKQSMNPLLCCIFSMQ